MKQTPLLTLLAVCAVTSVATARADVITGSIWEAPSSGLVDNVTDSITGVPSGTPQVTFSINAGAINMNDGSGYTIGSFLGSNPGGYTVTTGASELGNTLDDTLFQFKGYVTVTTGETFTIEHDDGAILTIGSDLVVNAGGPTSAVSTTETYTGPSGTEAFDLLYAEVDGPPAVLQVNLPLSSVPEPTTMVAAVLLLLPLGASAFRILRSNRIASV